MSGKSPSGFADLRAKFENKTSDTSPPSRGRSPVGKENLTGGSGRKVRTSFISVERSGQMSNSEEQGNMKSDKQEQKPPNAEGETLKAGVNGDENAQANGDGAAYETAKSLAQPGDKSKMPTSDNSAAKPDTMEPKKAVAEDAVNPDKPDATEEDDVPAMQPSDPKDESAVSGGTALAPKGESLGALLKGSDFEPVEKGTSKTASPKKSPKKPAGVSNPSTPTKNGKTPQRATPRQPKPTDSPKVNGSPKSQQPAPAQNSANEQSQGSPTVKSSEEAQAAAKDSPELPITPTSPTVSKAKSGQPLQKTGSPRQSLQRKDGTKPIENGPKKTSTQKPSRLSAATKPAPIPTSGPAKQSTSRVSSISHKPNATSPSTAKSRPKSPTRPARLPGAATASTAASAAKNGPGAPPSRAEASKPARTTITNKPAAAKSLPRANPPTGPGTRNKAPRSSLPAPAAEPKPKARASLAGTRASGGDFLARMMRPTQASASKTHEKVEQPKTPPKKRVSSKSQKGSDESEKLAESKSADAVAPAVEGKTIAQENGGSEPVETTQETTANAEEAKEEAPTENGADLDATVSSQQNPEPVFGP